MKNKSKGCFGKSKASRKLSFQIKLIKAIHEQKSGGQKLTNQEIIDRLKNRHMECDILNAMGKRLDNPLA